MHLASGLTLMSSVQPDPSSGSPSYNVTVVKLDPEDGELVDAEPGVADLISQTTPQEFLAARKDVRTRIDSMPPKPWRICFRATAWPGWLSSPG